MNGYFPRSCQFFQFLLSRFMCRVAKVHYSAITADRINFHRYGVPRHDHMRFAAIQACRQRQGSAVIARRMRCDISLCAILTETGDRIARATEFE